MESKDRKLLGINTLLGLNPNSIPHPGMNLNECMQILVTFSYH